jgi:methylmalonyl-CoA mutase C-terminal domain/subunit
MEMKRKLRILSGKMGLDCHDNGIVAISNLLKERGYEVIYLGLHNSAQKIVNAAIQEDVDLIGLSFLCGTHMPRIMELRQLMEEKNVDIPLIVGGVIPVQDAEKLGAMGIKTFLPGTPIEKIEEEGILKVINA